MTQSGIDYAALEALEKAATPGPWVKDDYIAKPGDSPECWHIFEMGEDDPPLASLSWLAAKENAAFFVALRNAAPALIAAAKERDEFAILNELLKSALIKVEYDRDAARAILSRAGAALEPFAEQAECWPVEQDDMAMTTTDGIESASLDFRLSNLRAARSVLAEIKDALK